MKVLTLISGGDTGARLGTLSVMAGGDKADFDAVVPLFEAMGNNIVYHGPAGAGQDVKVTNQIMIAGALAGLGAGLFYLSGSKEWEPLVSTALPAAGFNGISVALLASSNPLGCIFSALFISHITTGGGFMFAKLFPSEVADIISGVVIYLCAFSLLFKGTILKLLTPKARKEGSA